MIQGGERVGDLTCGRMVDDSGATCGKPGVGHFLWNDQGDNGVACDHVANGHTTTWTTRALVRCLDCGGEVIVAVQLYATSDEHHARKPITSHATEAGYQAHRRRADIPCAPCLTAHNDYTAHRKMIGRARAVDA